jgi:hypothetical protein
MPDDCAVLLEVKVTELNAYRNGGWLNWYKCVWNPVCPSESVSVIMTSRPGSAITSLEVPVTTPVEVFRVRPVGKLPEVTAQLYGALNPITVTGVGVIGLV